MIYFILLSLNLLCVFSQFAPSKWKLCAKVGQNCNPRGFYIVRFGAENKYVYKFLNRQFSCNVNEFGTDPIPENKEKTCDFFTEDLYWTPCGLEGGKCNFKGTRFVRYGSNGNFWYSTATDAIDCTQEKFRSNSAGGTCFYGEEIKAEQFSWLKCADEWGSCNYNGSQVVRYGKNDVWTYIFRAGPISCTNNVFSDVLFGTVKECQYQLINERVCPANLVLNGRQCVSKCPAGSWLTVDKKSCVVKCPSGSLSLEGTNECTTTCPRTHFKKGEQCLKCKDGYKQSLKGDSCILDCPTNEVLVLTSYKSNERDMCLDACPSGYKLNQENKFCLQDCSDLDFFTSADNQFCVSKCPNGHLTLGNDCFFDCPITYYRHRDTCVVSCPQGTIRSPDDRSCITSCPNGTFLFKPANECINVCPDNTYLVNNECVFTCPANTFPSNDTHSCVQRCPDRQFYHKTTNICHSTCPANLLVSGSECVEQCPARRLVAADRRTCVDACPRGQFLVAARNSCYYSCPALWRVSGNTCVPL